MSLSVSREVVLSDLSFGWLRQRGKRRKNPSQLPVGVSLGLCFALSLAAILFRSSAVLSWLTLANFLLLLIQRPERQVLIRGCRLCCWQGSVVTGLYLLRYGSAGLTPGLHVSWQLLLVFLPGLILLSGASSSRIAHALSLILPARSAFVLATCMKFLPLLVTEISAIYEAQRLRGARVRLRNLFWPAHWGDFLNCLAAPVVVRVLEIADNIACAARTREFGRFPGRTCWPGNLEHPHEASDP
jgi:energy-coupling factor transporter transmembrane protein EcfT